MSLRKIFLPLSSIVVLLNACAAPPATTVPTLPSATLQPTQTAQTSSTRASATPTQMVRATDTHSPTAKPTATIEPTATNAPVTKNFAWTKLDAQNAPPPRFDHALAFDSDKQQLILFGGRAGGKIFGDTWIFDAATHQWREIKTPGPSERFGFASVYDPQSKAVYLFGGQKSEFYNDTWKFDTQSETWSEIHTQGAKPDIRYGHGVTLDTQNNRLIISHGFARDGRHNDTWALDLRTHQWTELTPSGDKPLNRCLHDIAYAPNLNAVYLFGGCSSGFGPCPQGDLWSLDLATNQWTLSSPTEETPSARENPAIVVDSETGNLILFGGKGAGAQNDLWVFDANAKTWNQIDASGPSARKSHDAVFDALNHRVFLFGGSGAEGALNDLWMLEF